VLSDGGKNGEMVAMAGSGGRNGDAAAIPERVETSQQAQQTDWQGLMGDMEQNGKTAVTQQVVGEKWRHSSEPRMTGDIATSMACCLAGPNEGWRGMESTMGPP